MANYEGVTKEVFCVAVGFALFHSGDGIYRLLAVEPKLNKGSADRLGGMLLRGTIEDVRNYCEVLYSRCSNEWWDGERTLFNGFVERYAKKVRDEEGKYFKMEYFYFK